MLLSTLLLSAVLSPQAPAAPPAEEPMPAVPQQPVTIPESPPMAVETTDVPAAEAELTSAHIEAGLAAFRRRRFARAREEFEKAAEADPGSAAAAFYLGYAHYKIAEPTRRLTPDKERAKELFARAYQLDPAFEPVWGRNKP